MSDKKDEKEIRKLKNAIAESVNEASNFMNDIKDVIERTARNRSGKDLIPWMVDKGGHVTLNHNEFRGFSQQYMEKLKHEMSSEVSIVYGDKQQLNKEIERLKRQMTESYDDFAVIAHGQYTTDVHGIRKPMNEILIGRQGEDQEGEGIYLCMDEMRETLKGSSPYFGNIYLISCNQYDQMLNESWSMLPKLGPQIDSNNFILSYQVARLIRTVNGQPGGPV